MGTRGRSPVRAKWTAYVQRTYKDPRVALQLVLCPCDTVRGQNVPKRVEVAVRDAAAKTARSLDGGYDTHRTNMCPFCYTVRSRTGRCLCNVT